MADMKKRVAYVNMEECGYTGEEICLADQFARLVLNNFTSQISEQFMEISSTGDDGMENYIVAISRMSYAMAHAMIAARRGTPWEFKEAEGQK